MNTNEKLAQLRSLQNAADAIRNELGISPSGRILFQASCDVISNDLLVVAADGFGHATTSIVEGNYPLDYCTKYEKRFDTESEAELAAEDIITGKVSAHRLLGAAA